MKLSTLIKTKDLHSITINIYGHYVVAEIFAKGRSKSKLKVYTSLSIDMPVTEEGIENVEHLGIKRCREFVVLGGFYINIYNW